MNRRVLTACRFDQAEFEMNMRLVGARNLKELVPEMVDASNIHQHLVSVPNDRLYDMNCKSRVFRSVCFKRFMSIHLDESMQGARLRQKMANKAKL